MIIGILLILLGIGVLVGGLVLGIMWVGFCFGSVLIGVLLFFLAPHILWAPFVICSFGFGIMTLGWDRIANFRDPEFLHARARRKEEMKEIKKLKEELRRLD